MKHMEKLVSFITNEYVVRTTVLCLALMTPFICLICYGYMISLSQYWNTPLQPLFILSNVATAHYFFSMPRWRASAILLILLTAFSVTMFGALHNIFAIMFFIVTVIPLAMHNHYRFCLWLYLTALLILPFSMTIAEIIAITVLCLFHALVLRKVYTLNKQRNNETVQ